jgi:hypothetical protein
VRARGEAARPNELPRLCRAVSLPSGRLVRITHRVVYLAAWFSNRTFHSFDGAAASRLVRVSL